MGGGECGCLVWGGERGRDGKENESRLGKKIDFD